MTKKSDKAIKEEINNLNAVKPKVREFSLFGDNNHEKIDAAIEVLEEFMSEDEIWDRWPPPDEDEDRDPNLGVREFAEYAMNWRDGFEKEAPSDSWGPIIKKTKKGKK